MKKNLLSRRGKSVVTTLLLIGTIASNTKSEAGNTSSIWASAHCIITSVWFLLTILHIWQHWALIKALCIKHILLRNKITTITVFCFALMAISILPFIVGLSGYTRGFHHAIGHIYIGVVTIHAITQRRRFIALLRR